MTSNRWQQVEQLFHEATHLAPEERERWLAGRCTGDEALAREVLLMLEADSNGGDTLERKIGDSVSAWLSGPASGQPDRAGSWRIVKPIGAGGMGDVYLAARDDDSYHQLAAVKILRPEQLVPGMRERFRQERQILAELDHPNIARLLDGGTTADGRQYFVIEYVDGVPLTTFAKSLRLRERCELFAAVCDAVAYAHRNLIVHRDLKPANILVDANGAPKLLDFGIAKLIGVDHGMTASMHAMFTPDYASPEQIRGGAITTATDVFALGAVLYELITGRPIRSGANRSFADLVNEVTNGTIPPASRAASERIPVDLDRIVAKALETDTARRYGTADQLAADLRRFLNGRPVEARGTSFFYLGSKFVRRHWLPLAALALLVSGLAASTVWSIEQARLAAAAQAQAELQRDRAERALEESDRQRNRAEANAAEAAVQRASAQDRFDRSRKLTHKFLFDVEDALKNVVGSVKARELLVSTALEHFEQMGREAENDPALIRDLARSYDRIGDLQGYPAAPANLGDTRGAVKSFRQSLRWHQKRWHEPETRLLAGYTATKLAKTLLGLSEIDEAEKSFAFAAAALSNLEPSLSPELRLELIRYRSNLNRSWGEHWQTRKEHRRAAALMTASIQDLRRAIAARPEELSFQRLLSSDNLTLSRSLAALEDWPEALRTAENGLHVMRVAIGAIPPIRDQARLIPPGVQLVDILEHSPVTFRDIPRALIIDQELVVIAEKLVAVDSANIRNRSMFCNVFSRYAGHLYASWRWPEALAAYQRAQAAAEALTKLAPANHFYQDLAGTNSILMGLLLFDMQEDAAAEKALRYGTQRLEKAVEAGRADNQANLRIGRECLAQIQH